jgi:hypothetical protein
MREDFAASVRTRPVLTGLLGFGLGVVRGDYVAVLLLDVPAVSARDDVNVRHLPSPFPGPSRETIGRGNCEREHGAHDVLVAVVKPPWVLHSITRSDDFDAIGFRFTTREAIGTAEYPP